MTIVLAFMSFWLGIVGLICIGLILAGLFQFGKILQNGLSPKMFIPFGMFAFGYLLIYLAFKTESKKSKEFLATLLEAQEMN
jgi:tellurite resistance protein TehA-like permease